MSMLRARLDGERFGLHLPSHFLLCDFDCYRRVICRVAGGPVYGVWFWCLFGVGIGATMIYRASLRGHRAQAGLASCPVIGAPDMKTEPGHRASLDAAHRG